MEAVKEAIQVARDAGLPVQISHLKAMWRRNWDKIDAVFEEIEKARDEGLDVTADRYPYLAACTDLDAILPARVYQGGRTAEAERLSSDSERDRIYEEVLTGISEEELSDEEILKEFEELKSDYMEFVKKYIKEHPGASVKDAAKAWKKYPKVEEKSEEDKEKK